MEAVRLAEDVVLVTYQATRQGGHPGKRSLRSSVWRRGRVLFHQGTIQP
jgi:hypothetical protein